MHHYDSSSNPGGLFVPITFPTGKEGKLEDFIDENKTYQYTFLLLMKNVVLNFFGCVLIEINKSQPFHLTDSTVHPGGVKSHHSPSSPGLCWPNMAYHFMSQNLVSFFVTYFHSLTRKKKGALAFETH